MKSYLLCVCPIGGHVAPILTVARHLVNAGHRVRMLTGSRFASAVSATGAEFVALPEEADFDDRNLDRPSPSGEGTKELLRFGTTSSRCSSNRPVINTVLCNSCSQMSRPMLC